MGVLEEYARSRLCPSLLCNNLNMYRVKLAEALGALLDGLLAENERVGEEKVRALVCCMFECSVVCDM